MMLDAAAEIELVVVEVELSVVVEFVSVDAAAEIELVVVVLERDEMVVD